MSGQERGAVSTELASILVPGFFLDRPACKREESYCPPPFFFFVLGTAGSKYLAVECMMSGKREGKRTVGSLSLVPLHLSAYLSICLPNLSFKTFLLRYVTYTIHLLKAHCSAVFGVPTEHGSHHHNDLKTLHHSKINPLPVKMVRRINFQWVEGVVSTQHQVVLTDRLVPVTSLFP